MSRMIQGQDGVWREPPGHEALWAWFGLSRASWMNLPRVLMHAMPDDWQAKMAALLTEYDQAWDIPDEHSYETQIQLLRGGRFAKVPDWLAYRHPGVELIESFRRSTQQCSTGNSKDNEP